MLIGVVARFVICSLGLLLVIIALRIWHPIFFPNRRTDFIVQGHRFDIF